MQLVALLLGFKFQSTLPHGSDLARCSWLSDEQHFNPRSLTGATSFVF